ncbi:ABC transporter permease [Alteromonas sp. 14N.309.X.WAT.G.H12]|uniref:ABC transporter permease n=1 Tax=Alteromonas sp. 14N.309.X.WAT.G.H12 TaxID=3120824 RepID=UPI002FCE86F3
MTDITNPQASIILRLFGPRLNRFLSLVLMLVIWQGVVMLFSPNLLPPPTAVFTRLLEALQHGNMLFHFAETLRRVGITFSLSLIFGSAAGLLMGHYRRIDEWFDGLLTLLLNVPALVTIILCFMWFGLNEKSALLAVIINKLPNVTVTLREGARAIDTKLLDVARVYHLSPIRTFLKVYLPQLAPYLLAAARSGLALVWKIVLVVELIGCSSGVGFQLSSYFQLFDVTAILAYTLAFVAIVYAIESLILRPIERYVSRWRQC